MNTIFKLATLVIVLIIPSNLFAQKPTGTSANLCPNTTYRYTSAPKDVNGGACDNLGWICNGCVTPNGTPSNSVIASGVNTDGTLWADVKWDNVASGAIGTICGNLSVQINSITQASISGPSTVLLCGTSSITLQASVSSTTNIVGYTWQITGTGVSPTGTVNTSAPQLTINYTNWTAGSSLSATVAVAARSACGFTTHLGPLADIAGISAIPRSAWVQLSPGNINNLQIPLSFNPPLICTTGTMTVSNQPSNTSLVWSSGNTSGLEVTPTGAAKRLNNYGGYVTVSATLANACGSNTQSTNVWLGIPAPPGPVSGEIAPSIGGIYQYVSAYAAQGAAYHNWLLPYNGNPLWSQNGGNINGIIDTLTPSLIVGQWRPTSSFWG